MQNLRLARVPVAIGSLVTTAVLAGCGPTDSGLASPNSPHSSAGVSPGVSSPASSEPATSVDPCSLLTLSELSRYGDFHGPDESTLQGDPVCSWRVDKESAADVEAPLVDVTFLDSYGVSDVVDMGDGVQSGTTNTTGRKLAKTSGINPVTDTPDCLIAMEIGEGSRLDVMVGFTAEPCELAGQIVEMVDSKLPRG